ncbi:hypothetical protein O988_03271 [Pseudogymnoascus sp. VKM F-3808]|nr:hypothetical protein O988_03271 [Pseudogymnoascus sp. VKM F-3808]
MRVASWSAIAIVWTECSGEPTVEDPDVVINVYEARSTDPAQPIMWKICHEVDLFNDYVDLLLRADQLSVKQPMNTVDFRSLVRQNQLGGRGCTTLAHVPSNPQTKFVFKGVDFRTFLFSYESGHIQEEVKIFYRSTELVCNLPPHPNIMAPTQTLVSICKHGDDRPFVCGSLYPFIPNGTLANWEQSDAPVTTAASEIDGTWDVEEIPGEGNSGWNIWNVFLEWSENCPKALELVEVFSLGRSMWMLLRQPDLDNFDDVTCSEEVVEDWESAENIPDHWKNVVHNCLHHDPNKRIGLRDLVTFWDSETQRMSYGST